MGCCLKTPFSTFLLIVEALIFVSQSLSTLACGIDESSLFIIHGESVLPVSATTCFNSCHSAKSNCTGVIFQAEKCITIDKLNYFGQLPEVNYIEKQCLKKTVHKKLLVTEWNDRVLVDHTQKITKAADKLQCLSMCANEKGFPCLSAMFYPESEDCLLNSASSSSAKVKMDTSGYPVLYMELHGMKEPLHCSNAFKMVGFDEMEIRGETKLFDGTGGLTKCIARCAECDFIVFNEIFSECFLVTYDPTGQVLDFINDEYQILFNECSDVGKDCSSQKAMYISYQVPDQHKQQYPHLKGQCLEMCTMQEDCQFAYQSKNLTNCIITRRKMALPLVAQKVCGDIDDLPDGSAILFDQIGGCKTDNGETGGLMIAKGVELHQCMQLCATHPTRSCESISYTKDKRCYLHDGQVDLDAKNFDCTVFTLNAITFETGTQTRTPPRHVESKTKEETKLIGNSKPKNQEKAKTFASGNGKEIEKIDAKKLSIQKSKSFSPVDVQISTQCNLGDISVKISSKSLKNGEIFVRNGHSNCSSEIDARGQAVLKIRHNDTSCPMTQTGDIFETVVVVSQSIVNSAVITNDDQFFKVRCDYSNQKKPTVIAKTMNLRNATYSQLDIHGNVKIKPMSMELRAKRETVKAQSVVLGQSLDLIFKSPLSSATNENSKSKKHVFIRRCLAFDNNGDEKIVFVNNGCATKTAKEYVLRGEIEETADGFSLPFRAFRFKQGESVRIECEVKYCQNCKKPNCSNLSLRNRRYVEPEDSSEGSEKLHAELLVRSITDKDVASKSFDGYCVGLHHFLILASATFSLLAIQIIILTYFCATRTRK